MRGMGGLSSRRGSEFLDHCQQQLAIAVIQIGGIPADLRQEAELVVREFLRLELTSQRIFGKQLSEWKFECSGDFSEGVQRRNGVSVLHS